MKSDLPVASEVILSTSFLEYAFLRWVLQPSVSPELIGLIEAQPELDVGSRKYRLDYEIRGAEHIVVVELDGFAYHGSRQSFSYDRMRQNDLQSTGRIVVRFSYDSIRFDTERCVRQLQSVLSMDSSLGTLVVENPAVEIPEMDPDPIHALDPSPAGGAENMDT